MPTAGTLYTPALHSLPRSVPSKRPTYAPAPAPAPAASHVPAHRIATSPPSMSSSVRTSAVPSLTSGSTSGDHETSSHSVDLMDMMTGRLSNAVNPIPMDRSIARQAQTSGELNAKQRELAELQALAQRRLKSTRANLADGMKAAKEVRRDLEWTQKKVSSLNAKAASKYPTAHRLASSKYPSPADY